MYIIVMCILLVLSYVILKQLFIYWRQDSSVSIVNRLQVQRRGLLSSKASRPVFELSLHCNAYLEQFSEVKVAGA
jgi:hypothetical protein